MVPLFLMLTNFRVLETTSSSKYHGKQIKRSYLWGWGGVGGGFKMGGECECFLGFFNVNKGSSC
jgi:hypothetical protein